MIEVELFHSKTNKSLGKLNNLTSASTIRELKEKYQVLRPHLYVERQAFRSDPRGKSLRDDATLQSLGIETGDRLYFKDLGPQVGWTTVFLTEYAGPLVIYLLFYARPQLVYGKAASSPKDLVVHLAAACWTGHYAKRLLETVFVHRFSHATMPIMNIFKNSAYYWGFTAFVAYFVNHPLYTSPGFGPAQIYLGLAAFIFCELGNFSIHVALRNLRPAGTKVRRIPYPGLNPFTLLFKYVSCPNYTFEVGAWASFTLMTQCLPAGLFMLAGFAQMSIWSLGKHRNYRREFPDYPRGRKGIIPFVL